MLAHNQRLMVDFEISSDSFSAKPRRLFLEDSGGWVRISKEKHANH